MSMFGNTYPFEQLFSIMNIIKSQLRSQVSDEYLQSAIRLTSSNNITPNIPSCAANKTFQLSNAVNYN